MPEQAKRIKELSLLIATPRAEEIIKDALVLESGRMVARDIGEHDFKEIQFLIELLWEYNKCSYLQKNTEMELNAVSFIRLKYFVAGSAAFNDLFIHTPKIMQRYC